MAQCVRRTIAEAKQYWSIIGWVTKNLLTRDPPCFARHVKPLVPAGLAVVSNQSTLGPRGGLWPILLVGKYPHYRLHLLLIEISFLFSTC
jgi:hypothetical protein